MRIRRYMPVLQSTLDYLMREYRAVARAPVTFGAILVAAALISGAAIWSFRGDANLLRQQVAEYREKLHGASPDEAKTALDVLADEVTALQAQLKARRGSSTKRQGIPGETKRPSGAQYAVTIVYEGGCWDCSQYAADL